MLATIGYERATPDDFIATLRIAKIRTLVDVRERAQSRRSGFSKKALAKALGDAGVEYVHFPELGDPKEGRNAARAGNVALFLSIFRDAMSTAKAKEALTKIEVLASEQMICLMCFERSQNDCHRRIIAEEIENRLGIKASHWRVIAGASNGGVKRRMLHSDQSAASSI